MPDTWKYRISELDYDDAELEAVEKVVQSKWLSTGPVTNEFEQRFAAFLGAKHAVALSSGTAALHLAMLACDIGPGDEVLVPSYTFVASANPIVYVGASPVFVDIVGPHDLNFDPDDAARKITPRTKAIVVVHLAGFPADMQRIMELARKHNLVVIEDACHALGSRTNVSDAQGVERLAGTVGTVGCFSFFANKNMACGEGGALVTDDESIALRARLGRSHGMTKSSWDKASGRASEYDVVQVGLNYRCTDLTAALALSQLKKLPAGNDQRERLARYRERLAGVPGITIPFADRLQGISHHIFPILLDATIDRAEFRARLTERGIQTTFHYPPVHHFTHYRRIFTPEVELHRTLDAASREVTLPLHALLTESDIDSICDTVLSELKTDATMELTTR